MKYAVLLAGLCSVLSFSAAAETIYLDGYITVNGKCQSQPRPTVTVVSPPAVGYVYTRPHRMYPRFPAGNTYAHCNDYVRVGTGVFYTRPRPSPAVVFTVRVRYRDGETNLQHIAVPATGGTEYYRMAQPVRPGRGY